MQQRSPALQLLIIGLVAFLLRLSMILLFSEFRNPAVYEHLQIAENLAQGRGFITNFMGTWGYTSVEAPAIPVLLGACFRGFGEGDAAYFTCQAVLALFSSASCALLARLGSTLFTSNVGWAAGIISACYPALVVSPSRIQVVSLSTFLIVAAAAAVFDSVRRPNRMSWIWMGRIFGFAALVDPILLVLMPASVLYILWQGRGSRKESLRCFALVVLITGSILAPWLVRNWIVHHRFVPVKSTFWLAFWQGNNPSSEGTDKVFANREEMGAPPFPWHLKAHREWLRRARDGVTDINSKMPDSMLQKVIRLAEIDKIEVFREEILQAIAADPARYLRLCARRLKYFILFDETNPMTLSQLYRWPRILLLSVFAWSTWIFRKRWRELSVVYLFLIAATLFHSVTIVAPRFQIAFDPLLILIASAVIPAARPISAACELLIRAFDLKALGACLLLAGCRPIGKPCQSRVSN
jgi:4-amino-4-deoxy-L-arabinose transferase-like glycosyltransferase